MTIKKTVISTVLEQTSWKIAPSMLIAALLVSAPMPLLAAVYEDDEEDEADYSEVALVTQRINQFSNTVDFRLRYLTDDAFKFGEYNSQDEKGWQLDGSFDLEQRDFEDGTAKYLRAEGNSIGTKSRDITFEAGQQGDHKFQISFDGIEKVSHGSFVSQYAEDPSDPYGLVASANNDQSVKAYRERLGLLFKKQAGDAWRFSVDVNQENKTGGRDYAVGNKLYLYPMDYTTNNINLMAEYVAKKYQFQMGYEFSQFDNAGESMTAIAGGFYGNQAQEPDSLTQTLFWNGVYRISDTTRANAYLSYAVAEQDEAIIGGAGATADAEVASFIARLGVSSRITNKLSVEAKYDYRDNDTKTGAYIDAGSSRENPQLDTITESLALSANYRLPKTSKVSLGYKHEEIERPGSDREKTKEDKLWATYKLPMMGRFSGTLKLSAAERDGSAYSIGTAQVRNSAFLSGTQRFNLADREQLKAQFRGQYQLGATGYIGLMLQAWNDDYDKAEFGLQEVDGQMYTVDFGASPMRELSYSLYAGVQVMTYDQAGNEIPKPPALPALPGPDKTWTQETTDEGMFAGFHMDWEVVADKVATSFDYRYTDASAEISPTATVGGVDQVDDLEHKVHRVELTGEYFLDKQTTFVARAVYEDYESYNWAYQADDEYKDPNHNAALIELGMRYQF